MIQLKWLLLLCCMFWATGTLVAKPAQEIIIKGKVTNAGGKKIMFNRTIDGIFVQSLDTLQIQTDSTFALTIPAHSPEKFNFFVWEMRSLGMVYLKPGTVYMDIDATAESPFKMKQTLENETMKLLFELDCDLLNLRSREVDKWNIARDTVAISVYDKLVAYAKLLEKKLPIMTDKNFQSKAKQDIRMQLLLAFENQYFVNYSSDTTQPFKQEWNDAFSKMVEFANLNHPDNVFSSAFTDVTTNWLGIQMYYVDQAVRPKTRAEYSRVCFDGFSKNLNGKVREVAMANIILEDKLNEDYSPEIPELYNQFMKAYPQSVLLPFLNKAVAVNRLFNQSKSLEDIRFADSDSIHTFKELTDRFVGKVIFIDIWATWCSPCRKSFAYVKPLQQYAKEHDVVLLYISIDRLMDKNKWEKMAAYYDLKGEHVIVNEALDKSIRDMFGKNGALYIPHCGIVNKKGELQFPKAASPEDLDKLVQQLKAAAQ